MKIQSELFKIHFFFFLSLAISVIQIYLWGSIIFFLYIPLSLIIFHIGHGIFIHRYFTHGHFKFSKRGIFLGHLFFIMTNMGKALSWAGMHMKHHQYSGTADDPHEWRHVGLIRSIFSMYGPSFGVDKRFMIRLKNRPFVSFFNRYHYLILTAYLPLFSPVIALSFFWKQFTTIVVHYDFSNPRFGTHKTNGDTSVNLNYLNWLMWGDELHRDHHNHIIHQDRLHKLGKLWEMI